MYTIKKVLNSSVVLVENNQKMECIVLGKGIGFGKKAGQLIAQAEVGQLFVPVHHLQLKQAIQCFTALSNEIMEVTSDTVHYAEQQLKLSLNPSIYFTLGDHLQFALERIEQGLIFSNKVLWEIKTYYPQAYQVGAYCLNKMQASFQVEFPDDEIANIAFHIINAASNGEKRIGLQAAKLTSEIMNIVKYSLGMTIAEENIHYMRFITHVKFFAERFFNQTMLEADDDLLFTQFNRQYPKAVQGASQINEFIKQRYQRALTLEELLYLSVHIKRLMDAA